MKGAGLLRWRGSVLTPRSTPERIWLSLSNPSVRYQSSAAAPVSEETTEVRPWKRGKFTPEDVLLDLPSPPVSAASRSSKLAALHARLSLPSRLPIESLARTLVDPSADPSQKFNNKSFSVFGGDLLGYYTSEYIIAQYPRLPMSVVFAAMYAYAGPRALRSMAQGWGVEHVAEPGGEVDPGLLQYKALPFSPSKETQSDLISSGRDPDTNFRRTLNSRVVYDDPFGETAAQFQKQTSAEPEGVTHESASANFVRAVMGAIYLHAGRAAAKQFFRDHFSSRQLDISELLRFNAPSRDLSRLCAREGFQSPVARIDSETGRKSRHPVFVVGVYSGKDKLGEGVGPSLDEARTRAAISALKGWYLYSPLNVRFPSEMEEPDAKPWSPLLVDQGEIIS